MIFISLTALSIYIIYKNKNNLAFNILKLYDNIDNNLNIYLYNKTYIHKLYHNDDLIKINNINDIELNNSIIYSEYFIENKYLYQLNHKNNNKILDVNSESINKYINYTSSIISCSITVSENNKVIYKDYDITDFINKFIIYNCNIKLTNENNDYKKCFLLLLNKYFENRNIIIKDDYNIKWKIILENIEIIEDEEINITVKDGKLTFNNT